METETRSLKCNLTIEEKTAKADEAGRRLRDLESAQLVIDAKTRELKTAKETAASIQASLNGLIDTRERGWENRQVECHWRPDRAAQVKRLIRSDTGEVVETVDMPRQQTIDAVTVSVAKPKSAPELDGVEVGMYGEYSDGRHYRVDAVAPDSVVLLYADGETERVPAREWEAYAPDEGIDQQDYRDAFEAEQDAAPDFTPIEKSEDGQKLLRAADAEGKTADEFAAETGLAKSKAKSMCGLFVERGLFAQGERDTGKRGRKPVTFAITDEGEAEITSEE